MNDEDSFRQLARLTVDPLFVAQEGMVVFANPSALEFLGADRGETLAGKPVLSIFQSLDGGTAEILLEPARVSLEPATFAVQVRRLDGRLAETEATRAGIHWGEKPAILLVLRDVSARKRLEEAISSLAAFAHFNPNPVMEFSATGRLAYFNQAAAALARDLGLETPRAMLPLEADLIVQTCLASEQKKIPFQTALGGRTFSWLFFPVGENRAVHCYLTEVTDKQQLEDQLRHSQKLESVGRLASGVAHDFNNILTVIHGHLGLLTASPGLSPEMSGSLRQLSQAAERAGKLAGQLLAFSRKTSLHPRRLDLNEVLTNISMMLHRTLGEDINYQFSYAPALPPIYADLGMIEQVVMILAVNARDAMPRGGQLILSTSEVALDEAQAARRPEGRPGRYVCLTMVDSGCGMDEVTLGRMFEPFFTTKEFGKGTGLGLAVVYGIVQRHQGWVEVNSMVGQGSTFKLYFPVCTAEQEEASRGPKGKAIPGGTETVLVVEDEPPVRWIVKNILERYGYHVLEAGNGVEALAVWHGYHDQIRLLLADMVMPVGLTGQELAEKFRSQKAELKVIYTSGYSAHAAGPDLALTEGLDFLQKPFDPDKLALAVRKCLDG